MPAPTSPAAYHEGYHDFVDKWCQEGSFRKGGSQEHTSGKREEGWRGNELWPQLVGDSAKNERRLPVEEQAVLVALFMKSTTQLTKIAGPTRQLTETASFRMFVYDSTACAFVPGPAVSAFLSAARAGDHEQLTTLLALEPGLATEAVRTCGSALAAAHDRRRAGDQGETHGHHLG